jgi:hypothetical protein
MAKVEGILRVSSSVDDAAAEGAVEEAERRSPAETDEGSGSSLDDRE